MAVPSSYHGISSLTSLQAARYPADLEAWRAAEDGSGAVWWVGTMGGNWAEAGASACVTRGRAQGA
jgi:hypothetical protein